MKAVEPRRWSEPVAHAVELLDTGGAVVEPPPPSPPPALLEPELHPVRNITTTRAQNAIRPFGRAMPCPSCAAMCRLCGYFYLIDAEPRGWGPSGALCRRGHRPVRPSISSRMMSA